MSVFRRRPTGRGAAGPRNVLFIENSIGLSGSTMSLSTLLGELDRSRYAPQVVVSRANQKDYLEQALGPSIPISVVPWRNSLKSVQVVSALLARTARYPRLPHRIATGVVAALDVPGIIFPYVGRLHRAARGARIDLIQHNNGLNVRAVLLAKSLGVPLIAYQRGAEWNSPTVRYISRFVDAYIANSETTKDGLVELGVPSGRITVIYPPIDLQRFHPWVDASRQRHELGLAEGELTFGILGTLLKWKGQDVFLRAARLVLEALPAAKAVVVGEVPDGSTGYRDELIGLARELGIEHRTVFTGFRRDIPEMIQLLDVLVHASVEPEPFGRVIAEGMAMGKPVVASMLGGPLEILRDGETGFLVPSGEPEKLAHRIIDLLTTRPLAQRLGNRARVQAVARFSPPAHARLVERVYQDVLTAHGARSRREKGRAGCQPHELR